MHHISKTSSRGFSLLEMLVAMSLGLIVIGAAVQMYTKAVDVTWTVSQRAGLQQDARAAENLITKDISLANTGLSDTDLSLTNALTLATGAANRPTIGGDNTGACHLGAANNACVNYPADTNGLNHMYAIVPGWGAGPTISATAGATDVITIVSLDRDFRLDQYQIMFDDVNGNSVHFKLPAPAPVPAPAAINSSSVGLQKGDLVLFLNGAAPAIAEVTTVPAAGAVAPYVVGFANTSPLGFNQNAATSGNLKNAIIQNLAANWGAYLPTATFRAFRLWVVTYYIDNTRPTPTLMRLVNGRLPVPVAENVVALQFEYASYTFNADGSINSTLTSRDGGLTNATPVYPTSIRMVNLVHLTVRSQKANKQGYQAVDLHTSISARNLGFVNRYQ